MFKMLSNLAKAAVSVAVTPVMLVADVVTIPDSAMNNTAPFKRTADMLQNAGECIDRAVTPE